MKTGNSDKGIYEHYMLKEIYEQLQTIEESFRGRLDSSTLEIKLGGLNKVFPKIATAERIVLIGCGSSRHAALIKKRRLSLLLRMKSIQ